MISKKTISSKITIIALGLLLVFFGNLKFKQWKSHRQIEKEKQNLLAQADELQKKNDELNQSLQYLNSPSFKERVAREQLGLKKGGEEVFSFSDAGQNPSQESPAAPKDTNAQKWWDYFFGNQ